MVKYIYHCLFKRVLHLVKRSFQHLWQHAMSNPFHLDPMLAFMFLLALCDRTHGSLQHDNKGCTTQSSPHLGTIVLSIISIAFIRCFYPKQLTFVNYQLLQCNLGLSAVLKMCTIFSQTCGPKTQKLQEESIKIYDTNNH